VLFYFLAFLRFRFDLLIYDNLFAIIGNHIFLALFVNFDHHLLALFIHDEFVALFVLMHLEIQFLRIFL